MAGYLIGAVLLAIGSIHRLPTATIAMIPVAIALNIVMERHAARLFGRGARPSGILRFPGKLGAETAKRIKASWQAAHAGENSGGTAVLEEDGQFQALTLSSVESLAVDETCHPAPDDGGVRRREHQLVPVSESPSPDAGSL